MLLLPLMFLYHGISWAQQWDLSELCSQSHRHPRITEPLLFSTTREGLPSTCFSPLLLHWADTHASASCWPELSWPCKWLLPEAGMSGTSTRDHADARHISNQSTARSMMGCTNFLCARVTQNSMWLCASICKMFLHPVRMTSKHEQTNPVIWQRSMACQPKGLTDAFSFSWGRDSHLCVTGIYI